MVAVVVVVCAAGWFTAAPVPSPVPVDVVASRILIRRPSTIGRFQSVYLPFSYRVRSTLWYRL